MINHSIEQIQKDINIIAMQYNYVGKIGIAYINTKQFYQHRDAFVYEILKYLIIFDNTIIIFHIQNQYGNISSYKFYHV